MYEKCEKCEKRKKQEKNRSRVDRGPNETTATREAACPVLCRTCPGVAVGEAAGGHPAEHLVDDVAPDAAVQALLAHVSVVVVRLLMGPQHVVEFENLRG